MAGRLMWQLLTPDGPTTMFELPLDDAATAERFAKDVVLVYKSRHALYVYDPKDEMLKRARYDPNLQKKERGAFQWKATSRLANP